MLQPFPITKVTKLGATRTAPSSRIWIEGQRLIASGFFQGMKFMKFWDLEPRRLVLEPVPASLTDHVLQSYDRQCWGTVSGKGGKPIIDVTGKDIINFFGCTHVEVTYRPGRITISPAIQGVTP